MTIKTVCMLSCLHDLYDDRIYWKEALSLRKHGYNVIHLGVSDKSYDKTTKEGIRIISIKRITYYKNSIIDKLYRFVNFKENIYSTLFIKAREINAQVYHLHDYQLNRIAKKLKLLEQKPYLIYDAHEPYPITIATTFSKNLLIKLFWHLYGRYVYFWELSKSKNYNVILTTEENVQKKFKHKHKEIPVEIVYNFTDIAPIEQSKVKKYDFIYCGGIRKRRGIFELLEALKILNERGIKSKTLLIGNIYDIGLEETILSFINRHELSENIKLKNAVPYNKISAFYEVSKIGLAIFNNVKVNRIIMPIKIFEYIVFGLPVITSNFGHMGNLTQTNKSGITVAPSNVVEITNAMEQLLTNESLYAELKNNCLLASSKYKWKLMEDLLIHIYSELSFK